MNEDWNEMMAYAPLMEEEHDTDYQKEEDLSEAVQKTVVERFEHTVSMESEDYYGAVEEEFFACDGDDDGYDDYQSIPKVSADIYSDTEY